MIRMLFKRWNPFKRLISLELSIIYILNILLNIVLCNASSISSSIDAKLL